MQQPSATGEWLRLFDPIAPHLAEVETVLAEQARAFDPAVTEYIHYILAGSGKRLRPSLALLAGGATGGIHDGHIKLGAIVELVHLATLAHDDVLDEAELRHGISTCNSRWGNEISVLVGDCLFAHALRLAASFPTPEVCRRVSEATNTVCSGEILQTRHRFDPHLTLAEYLHMVSMKTGALFAVSGELGGYLNGAPSEVVECCREFGGNLGIAYQLYDDCVDLLGQERQAGKSLGTDVKKGKLTLPLLLLLEHTPAAERAEVAAAIFSHGRSDSREWRELVNGNGVMGESLTRIAHYIHRADEYLAGLPANSYTRTLGALAGYLLDRSRSLLQTAAMA